MNTKLTPHQKSRLLPLEAQLQDHVKRGESKGAIEVATQIQILFTNDRSHYRLLRAKVWCFEAAVDANDITYAEAGLTGIRAKAPRSSRIHLEASTLLAVCFLRRKKIPEAKAIIRDAVGSLKNITSTAKRQQFQKRLIERVEQECILSEFIGSGDELDEETVQTKAIELVKTPEDQLFEFLGRTLPPAGLSRLADVRNYSILQLPEPDRKALPPAREAEKPSELGKKAFAIVGRIAWKALCKPDTRIYKLWSQKLPEVYEKSYFAAAIIAALKEWQIGASLFASGIVALAMKHSARDFCEWTKPKGLMIDRKDLE